jgi:hypothetical protein
MTEELLQQDLPPHRSTQQALGDQFRWGRSRDGSRAIPTAAFSLITSPSDPPPIGPHVDFDLLGVLGIDGGKGQSAFRTTALVFGELIKFLDHWQMAIVASLRSRFVLPLATLSRSRLVLALELIGAVCSRLLGFATKDLSFQLGILTAELLELGLKLLAAVNGLGVHGLVIVGLLSEVDVLASQLGDFLAQLQNFVLESSHDVPEISRLSSRE